MGEKFCLENTKLANGTWFFLSYFLGTTLIAALAETIFPSKWAEACTMTVVSISTLTFFILGIILSIRIFRKDRRLFAKFIREIIVWVFIIFLPFYYVYHRMAVRDARHAPAVKR